MQWTTIAEGRIFEAETAQGVFIIEPQGHAFEPIFHAVFISKDGNAVQVAENATSAEELKTVCAMFEGR